MDPSYASNWRNIAFLDQADARFGHHISPQQHQQYRHGLDYRGQYGYGWGREAPQPPTYPESIPPPLDSRSLKPPGNVVGAPPNPTVATLRNQVDPSISTPVHDKLNLSNYPQLKWPWQWGYARPTTGNTTVLVIAPINQETREVERASKKWGELVACEIPLLSTTELKKDTASTCLPTTEAKVRAVSSYLEHAKSSHVSQHQQPRQTFGDAINRVSEKETQFVGNVADGGQADGGGEYGQPTGRTTKHALPSKDALDEPSSPYTVRMPKSSPESVETSNRRVAVASIIESLGGLDLSVKPDPPKDVMLATKKLRKVDGEWVKIIPKVQRPVSDLGEGWEKIGGDEEWEIIDGQVIFE